jgi:hypothetical protein
MSKKAAEHHKKVQEHLTHAARHYGEAPSTTRPDITRRPRTMPT